MYGTILCLICNMYETMAAYPMLSNAIEGKHCASRWREKKGGREKNSGERGREERAEKGRNFIMT